MALKKNRSTFAFFAIILFLACLVMALGATAVILFLRNPINEPMSLLYGSPTPAATTAIPAKLENLATPTAQEVKQSTAAPTATPLPTEAPQPVLAGACGGQGNLQILLIGAEITGGVWPHGADAVRVVKVDFDHEKITSVSFPRDLWVRTASLVNQDIDATRLGLSYDYMYHSTIGAEKHRVTTATTTVGQALYDNFGVAPQTYLTIQMDNWTDMVDVMGGVDIYIPEAFDSDYRMHFAQGLQHLNGAQAKEFVRTYIPGGDEARRERQTQFAKALQENLLNAGMVTKLPELADRFSQSIVTDLSPQLMAQLTCMVQGVPKEKISFYEVSGDLVSARNTGEVIPVLDPKIDQIKAKLSEWLGE